MTVELQNAYIRFRLPFGLLKRLMFTAMQAPYSSGPSQVSLRKRPVADHMSSIPVRTKPLATVQVYRFT